VFARAILTQLVPPKEFYNAQMYYQNYATLHVDNPYIATNDAPKLNHLRELFPNLYKK
jgi:peptide-methionine (S)-S-oxide reductase